jgi:aspartate/tyrosine/aromatic aminotransferase
MFQVLQPRPTDALLGLMAAFREDPRSHKIDVGVGVYRDDHGNTPVMWAVKEAEKRLLQTQQSKTYLGMLGDQAFNASMIQLVAGPMVATLGGRIRSVQTTGGCAALRALADLIAFTKPDATVWLSDPTWINHGPLIGAARLKLARYPYFDAVSQKVKFDEFMAHLETLGSNDVVLLHGACHNPTGADLTSAQWHSIADAAVRRGFLPFVDLAYQGLGLGMDADADAVRILAAKVPEMLVAVSCSKSFGIYRERVGSAMVIGSDATSSQTMLDHVLTLIRGNYSMPPDHGAATVQTVLAAPDLNKAWRDELEGMRVRIEGIRNALSERFRVTTDSRKFDHIAHQKGMFSLLSLTPSHVKRLREEHAIYMPDDGRTNVAGLNMSQVQPFVSAVNAVLAAGAAA